MENLCVKVEKPFSKQAKSQVGLKVAKERYDCVNLALKDTKEILSNKMIEVESLKAQVEQLDKQLLDSKVETALAEARAKNLTAAKALIDFSFLSLQEGVVVGLNEQVEILKIKHEYLFDQLTATNYVLVPVSENDALNKSITDYVTRRKVK